MAAAVGDEHRWLERLVGDWKFRSEVAAGPSHPATTFTGTEYVRSLDGVWIVCEGAGDTESGSSRTLMTLGFDPALGRFTGTFVGTMLHHLWIYSGVMDDEAGVLNLDAEGPSMTEEGKLCLYRDSIAFVNEDHRTLTSRYQDAEGAWQHVLTTHYHRTA
jgi:hypothetical protein